jgi:hypothetical protein
MSSKAVRKTNEEHIPDAAWIIALWKAIHGGDPSNERVAAMAIASLANYVDAGSAELSMNAMQKSLKPLGISVTIGEAESAGSSAKGGTKTMALVANPGRPNMPFCFHWAGQTICIPRPKVGQSPWK